MSPARRARPGAADRSAEAALLAELAQLYTEVDARFAGWSCEASTDCCHFGRTGREPYVTSIELAAIVRERARGGRRVDAPAARSDRRRLPRVDDERRCPLLDAAGRCTVYAARPFGCRTFFCDRAVAGDRVGQRDINAFVARLRALAARLGSGDVDGRPLTRLLSG